jgi:3-phenylpropionate/trans-cinnamate dioxygenase ferredoxin component
MSEWVRLSIDTEPLEGSMNAVTVAGKRLILYRTSAGYFATDRRCTHQSADLLRGYFHQEVIECPVHQGRFSVRTGEALSAPACVALKTYSVKVTDGGIYIQQE